MAKYAMQAYLLVKVELMPGIGAGSQSRAFCCDVTAKNINRYLQNGRFRGIILLHNVEG